MTVADFGSTQRWIRDELAAGSQDGIVNVSSVATHPHAEYVACTVTVKTSPTDAGSSRLAVVDLGLGLGPCDVVPLDAAAVASPTWSPDGAHLALIVTESEAGLPTVWVLTAAIPTPEGSFEPRVRHELPAVDGAVESVAWSPDSSQLAFIVAPIGAEVSDVYGSGTIPSSTEPEWWPRVSPAPPERRRVVHT
jgi:dipeptidyl aminopeptidase/acylaminoacyl peptidase